MLGGDSQHPVARAGLVGRLADAASLKLENSVARLIGQQNLVRTVLVPEMLRALENRVIPDLLAAKGAQRIVEELDDVKFGLHAM